MLESNTDRVFGNKNDMLVVMIVSVVLICTPVNNNNGSAVNTVYLLAPGEKLIRAEIT